MPRKRSRPVKHREERTIPNLSVETGEEVRIAGGRMPGLWGDGNHPPQLQQGCRLAPISDNAQLPLIQGLPNKPKWRCYQYWHTRFSALTSNVLQHCNVVM